MSEIIILRAGKLVELDPLESGFAHGFGIFETIRCIDKRLHFWDDHWVRLQNSARSFGLEPIPKKEAVEAALAQLVKESGSENMLLKLSLLDGRESPRLYVYQRPIVSVPKRVTVRIDQDAPIHPMSSLCGHKTHNYMESIWLLRRARAAGFDDAIRLNAEGYLAETTTANLFWQKEGQWFTPSVDCGVLPGIVRKAICSLMPVTQGKFTLNHLADADSVFMTNAGGPIIPVDAIDGFWRRSEKTTSMDEIKRTLADYTESHWLAL